MMKNQARYMQQWYGLGKLLREEPLSSSPPYISTHLPRGTKDLQLDMYLQLDRYLCPRL
jgi:hypothetical protein